MKIVRSIRKAHEEQLDLNTRLKDRFNSLISSDIKPRWHYEFRLKSLDSFALKVETGRFDPSAIEDFFACTIVVENTSSIKDAVEAIEKKCIIISRRPKDDKKTWKAPEHFPFDDLRLYVKLKPDPALPPNITDEVLFEIQIKTYLQHAWAIATHDLIYKSADIDWAQQRIAFQTKAILESAEVAIASSSKLAKDPTINKEDRKTEKLKATLDLLKKQWSSGGLPSDLTRLAKTLLDFSEATGISLQEIRRCIEVETAAGRGTNITDLPPYLVIVQSFIKSNNRAFRTFITTADPNNQFKVLIPTEMDIPTGYPAMDPNKVVTC